MKTFSSKAVIILVAAIVVGLQACNGSSNSQPKTFEITLTNLTTGQPLSPPLAMLHSGDYQPFVPGEAASTALERLAEGGDNSQLLAEIRNNAAVLASQAASAAVAPGASASFSLSAWVDAPRLSVLAMLVNSNDAFAALRDVDLSGLAAGGEMVYTGLAYDAGTEANSETAASIPGQGGEGYNSARDDRDTIIVHPGVISMDDGLSTSALDASHRFDNPVIRLRVKRAQ